jgi:hypothetical protein
MADGGLLVGAVCLFAAVTVIPVAFVASWLFGAPRMAYAYRPVGGWGAGYGGAYVAMPPPGPGCTYVRVPVPRDGQEYFIVRADAFSDGVPPAGAVAAVADVSPAAPPAASDEAER